ncbi:MAG TPA: hypothetical protein VKV80_13170 [Streptosporangiaceae bacterium]|nr:hypothetical protein [Streptosporangiaceae bacterium]
MSDFGDALARWMQVRHVGVRELARISRYSAGYIARLRNSFERPSPECGAELDEVLGAGGELAALATGRRTAPDKDALAPAMLPPRLITVTGADDVSPVEHLRRFRDLISDHDSLFGPRALIPVVCNHLALIRQIRHGRAGSTARDLLILQAQYAETLAWQYQDCAEFRSAQYWLDRALEWAHMAHDMQWAAFVLARKSQLAGDMHDPVAAVGLAEAAARLTPGGGARLRAAVAAYEAHGYALAGNPNACQRALEDAAQIAASPEGDPAAPWAAWLTPAYVEMARARCLDALGDHEDAVTLFEHAIGGIPATLRRERGVHLARQAVACLGAGDPAGASDAGVRAARIAGITQSGRIITELRRLGHAMRRRWPSHSATNEVHRVLASLLVPGHPAPRGGNR